MVTAMIDLHCHILPGCDDGAPDLTVSLAMARAAIEDGITTVACTPHIVPGVYDNDGTSIRRSIATLRSALHRAGLKLTLVEGADVHIDPGLVAGLKNGRIPSLNGSRYFLFEPPHHVAPPRLREFAIRLIEAGFVPIVTHPERLTWAKSSYPLIQQINDDGCLMQITAGSLEGRFGKGAQALAERMVTEGRVDIIASDAHNLGSRPMNLSRARDLVAAELGIVEARRMVQVVPGQILRNEVVRPAARRRREAVPTETAFAQPRKGRWAQVLASLKGDRADG
jgi:protein-tyrosine phosphatase